MKGVVLLLCVIAAVQGRSGVQVDSRSSLAQLEEHPWLVHLRFVTNLSDGLLVTCVGTLISNSHVLTTASCIFHARFIWNRFGVVEVIRPSLVIESNSLTTHPSYDEDTGDHNLAIIFLNRVVETSSSIAPIPIELTVAVPDETSFCAFGVEADGSPGEHLSCEDVIVRTVDGLSLFALAEGAENFKHDHGAPLVSNGRLIGVLTDWPENFVGGTFVRPGAYMDWISENIEE